MSVRAGPRDAHRGPGPSGAVGGRAAALMLLFVAIALVPLAIGASPVTLEQLEYVGSMCMVVVGLNVVTGYAGQLSLGPGAIFGVAGYAAALTAAHAVAGGGLLAMVVVGVAAAGVAGLAIGVPALRVGGFYLGMTTLLLAALVPVIASNWDFTGRTGGIQLIAIPTFVQRPSGTALYVLVVAVLFVLVVLSWATRTSRLGRRFAALRSSEELVAALGISSYRTKLLAFVLSAVPAGLGGAFYVFSQQTISPGSTSATLSVYLLAAAVIGGLGTVLGPVVGGAIVLGLTQFLGGLAEYEGIIYGVLLILVVELVPGGLVGIRGRIGSLAAKVLQGRRSLLTPALGARLPAAAAAPVRRPVAADDVGDRTAPTDDVGAGPPGATAGGDLLEIRGLAKSFGGVLAVGGVDLLVRPGHLSALIGPNGSGKTTLINLITGYYRPDHGTVALGALPLQGRGAAARAGVLRTFQTPKLMLEDTVLENVMVAADRRVRCRDAESVLRVGRGRQAHRVSETAALTALERLGIARYADEVAGGISHGIQRLVEMARAVSMGPRFLLLDEPAAGLTPAEIATLSATIRALVASGVGVLLVEHNVRLVLELAEDVTVVHQGRRIAYGPPSVVRADPEVVRVFLGRVGSSLVETLP